MFTILIIITILDIIQVMYKILIIEVVDLRRKGDAEHNYSHYMHIITIMHALIAPYIPTLMPITQQPNID